jgi:hypothetical protein
MAGGPAFQAGFSAGEAERYLAPWRGGSMRQPAAAGEISLQGHPGSHTRSCQAARFESPSGPKPPWKPVAAPKRNYLL